jgi:dTDP-3-amino-3,4,6-trideoxy-alpha-D-glucose transaminase
VIPLNDFQRQWEDTRADAMAAFEAVGASGWYILGREVREFEEALARCWGMGHAVGVASGLDAIEISLRALGCGPGDRVLTTPLSAFPSTLAIVKLGAAPVFADTDECGLIDLDACYDAFRSRPDIQYFLPVHLYGHPLDMRRLRALREQFGCRMVEDSVQSIGALHCGTATGTEGQMAAVSFYPTKNLGALGDGGAILTGDPELAETARRLRDYGQSAHYRHELIGYNSRLDELHACYMRRVALPRLPAWTQARRRIAAAYIAGIRNPAIRVLAPPVAVSSAWHLFPVLVDPARKADFMTWLDAEGVASGEHYPMPIPDQPALRDVPCESIGSLPTARRICRSEVSLPVHPYLRDDEIARVVEACNTWGG